MVDPVLYLGGYGVQELQAYRLTTQTFRKKYNHREGKLWNMLRSALALFDSTPNLDLLTVEHSSLQSLWLGLARLQS